MLPEERLLAEVVRFAEGFRRDIALLYRACQIDWERFLSLAEFHGVAGIVWKALGKENFPLTLPVWVSGRLRDMYYGICAANTLALESLKTISAEFALRGIDFIVVKGVSFFGALYEDIGQRPINDIDILIKQEDLPLAESVLKSIGFENFQYSPREFVKEMVVVELHTKFVDLVTPVRLDRRYVPALLTDEEIWNDRGTINISGISVTVLSERHVFGLSVLHTTYKHEFERLIWCIDFVRMVNKIVAKDGWRRVVEISKETGISHLVSDALLFASLSFGLRVPEEVRQRLEKKGKPLLQRWLVKALHNGMLKGLSRHTYSLLRTCSFRGKINFLLRAITPSRKVLSQQSKRRKPGLFSYIRHSLRMCREAVGLMRVLLGL